MDMLDADYAAGIFAAQEPPCLSLYQRTHRSHPDNQQDPIRFRNLVKELEESLRQKYSTRDVRPLLGPFQALVEDKGFWNHTFDGLAVLGAAGMFRIYKLQRPVDELAVVADSFHVKPLLRILQSADRYHILGLSRQGIRLFKGNRDVLDELELAPAVQRAITAALEVEQKEPHVEVWTHGSGSSGGEGGVRHGSGSRADESSNAADRFFRAVDRSVLEHYSRPSGRPLLLAALPENQADFRRVSHSPYLLAEAIDVNPDALTIDALRERAWKVVEPHFHARLAGLTEMFGIARSRGFGFDDLATVAVGAVSGRVASLLIDADRCIPGRIDFTTGAIEFDELANPEVDDLLDELGELVLKHGGQVVVVPSEQMPTKSGLAAIYRF
jgi:hypothetical protein